jgi:hypothetical protein
VRHQCDSGQGVAAAKTSDPLYNNSSKKQVAKTSDPLHNNSSKKQVAKTSDPLHINSSKKLRPGQESEAVRQK